MRGKQNTFFDKFEKLLLGIHNTVKVDKMPPDEEVEEHTLYLHFHREEGLDYVSINIVSQYVIQYKLKDKNDIFENKIRIEPPTVLKSIHDDDNDACFETLSVANLSVDQLKSLFYHYWSQQRLTSYNNWYFQAFSFLGYLSQNKYLDKEEVTCLDATYKTYEMLNNIQDPSKSIPLLTSLIKIYEDNKSLVYYPYKETSNHSNNMLYAIAITALTFCIALAIGIGAGFAAYASCYVIAGCLVIGVLATLGAMAVFSYPLHTMLKSHFEFRELLNLYGDEEIFPNPMPPYESFTNFYVGLFASQKEQKTENLSSKMLFSDDEDDNAVEYIVHTI